MNRRSRVVVLVAVVGCALLLAGCLGGGGESFDDPPENVTAADVAANASAAMGDLDAVRIDLTLTVDGNQGTLFEAESETVVDRAARRMRTRATADPLLQNPIELTQYTINGTSYTRTDGEWERAAVDEGVWERDPISIYEEMLAAGDTDLRGVQTFEGSEVYVIDTGVDGETIAALLAQQAPESGPIDGASFDGLTVRQYVDTETYHVRYLEVEFETSQFGTDGRTTVSLTTTLSGFDETFDITVPAGAPSA